MLGLNGSRIIRGCIIPSNTIVLGVRGCRPCLVLYGPFDRYSDLSSCRSSSQPTLLFCLVWDFSKIAPTHVATTAAFVPVFFSSPTVQSPWSCYIHSPSLCRLPSLHCLPSPNHFLYVSPQHPHSVPVSFNCSGRQKESQPT